MCSDPRQRRKIHTETASIASDNKTTEISKYEDLRNCRQKLEMLDIKLKPVYILKARFRDLYCNLFFNVNLQT